ncbi:MAG: SAM-dependent DNA methyltransferase [Candidatus Hydrogenedentes bacterium]|nr:SAM-dependent DNA methyltransferase [Candidatus Hydrogenedentota bacterium]
MSNTTPLPNLPRSGPERELLREKGQFWTPDWVADVMAAYVLQEKSDCVLDPALGGGAFFRAAKRLAKSQGFDLALFGRDIDPNALALSRQAGLDAVDLANVEIRDFVLDPPKRSFPAIIANPPYIRHHRIDPVQKERLREYARTATNRKIDGRAGLHVYFLIRALQTLSPGGRLAYIVSADICEGVFAGALWQWVCNHYRLDAVVTFTRETAPFPDVDTNALIFFIQKAPPRKSFHWISCRDRDPASLMDDLLGASRRATTNVVHNRLLSEALATGLSRPPSEEQASRYALGDFASVMRGVVTGDNEFFFMTLDRAKRLGIPESFLIKAIGRTRDVRDDCVDDADLERLEAAGRPTRLLYVNGTAFDLLPFPIQEYLNVGEQYGLPEKTLIKTRRPWYRMETREVPPILFAYLGRRNTRFIRNRANVVPLTSLLCVYPKLPGLDFEDKLWSVLTHPDTIANLKKVGKSYGGDSIKVEPRALERLPLPDCLVHKTGLGQFVASRQGMFDLSSEFR